MFLNRRGAMASVAAGLGLSLMPDVVRAQGSKVDVAALLKDLIRFNTVNAPGDTREMAAYLTTLFNSAGVPNETILAPNGKAAHFIARLKGNGTKKPVLIAAHTDVVPVERERWSVDPFEGVEKEGFIYGRGALDNKAAVAVFAQAVLRLAKEKRKLSRDVIFLAEADEEQGAFNTNWLAANHWDKIDAEFCLNEGGRTFIGAQGVREMQVSCADKLTLNLKIRTSGPTGHSSRPLPVSQTANGQLIEALARLSTYETEIILLPQVEAYLKASAKLNPGPYADAVAALLNASEPAARKAAARRLITQKDAGWGTEGLLRNTLVISMINSGIKPNVIPGNAEAVMNARLLPGQKVGPFIEELKAVIGNPKIEFEIVSTRPKDQQMPFFDAYADIIPSTTDTELYKAIERGAKTVWPQVTVMPTLLVASTDATPWRLRGVPVYGLGPVPVDADTASRIHGDDERVGVEPLKQGARFAYEILKTVSA
ncbi:M20/M25/M40 family metallo-hydrolase [Asticcacaulis endophyticus]|uniref:Peptidase M20 dimerisation domain-containing protein n=1 Tax=Asticcacaulis endophyticus TaxID=1395890 RepID=A0A918Q8B0_9CAUL|nr:M20/M25/M40 family metallo-hydrolase [Asticcacaulis endophyticus]GGZ35307.1 hypothetical protein GCM10011273_22270 [Asticcacaulis endophyticus]